MSNESPRKALLVVFCVALVCSILVSVAAVSLKPIQLQNQLLERGRNIISLTGLVPVGQAVADDQLLELMGQLDHRLVSLDTGEFDASADPADFDARRAASDPERSTPVPADLDVAALSRRADQAEVFLVWGDPGLERIILPIHGQGMWSTIYGFLALESDLKTIGAVSFYEQAETAGLGDQIMRPDWQAQWSGRRLFDDQGSYQFGIAAGSVDPSSAAAAYRVDGISGATITGNAVGRIVEYWVGPHGFGPLLDRLTREPPVRPSGNES